jgi:hypothetical protein
VGRKMGMLRASDALWWVSLVLGCHADAASLPLEAPPFQLSAILLSRQLLSFKFARPLQDLLMPS